MSVTQLPLTELDRKRAMRNPYKLTKCQCYTLRLVCKHGGTKRAAYVEKISERILEHHLMKARQQMGMFGNDIRMYLMWDRWTRTDEGELYDE
jgi:DNA-binding CsgD family transcriptional regulator